MVNKLMEKCSIFIVIREMLIKITMSYHYIYTRMAKIKETQSPNVERMESHWVYDKLLVRVKNVTITVVNF